MAVKTGTDHGESRGRWRRAVMLVVFMFAVALILLLPFAAAVNGSAVQTGSLTIWKQTEPATTTSFGFYGDLGEFTLAAGESKFFADLEGGNYGITEDVTPGWYLHRVECDGQVLDQNQFPFIIELGAGENKSCTFYNRRLNVVPDAGGPYETVEGSTIDLDATGTFNKQIVKQYRWDCTADGTYEILAYVPLGSSCPYVDDGLYAVQLQTLDVLGRLITDTAVVNVANVAPMVDAGEDKTTVAGEETQFAGSFTDPGTEDTHSYKWNFGDGITVNGTLSPTHSFANSGRYTVTLTVTDDDDGVGSDELLVDVANSPPSFSDVEVNPDEIDEGQSFRLSGSMFDSSTNSALTLAIDWGDGMTETQVFNPGTSVFSLNHTAVDDVPTGTPVDTHTITLELTDDEGAPATMTETVTVHNVAPVVDAGADKFAGIGESLSFKAEFVDPGTADTHSITWDFGDSTVPEQGAEATHFYAQAGKYTVTVTVVDDDGGVGEDMVEVLVGAGWYLPVVIRP